MKFVIFYFSGSGNTKLIGSEIKCILEEKGHLVEFISIEDTNKVKQTSLEGKIIGFGYPVYKFTYPSIFDDILDLLNQGEHIYKYFQYSTYARFSANSATDFSHKLDSDLFHLLTFKSFKCPSCGISARKAKDDYEYKSVMFFENDIRVKLDAFVEDILRKSDMQVTQKMSKHSCLGPIKLRIVEEIERTKYPKLQIDTNKCTLCGLCSLNCPDSDLKEDIDFINIIDEKNCLHCLRCMNHCPSNAINFGKLSHGKNRYTLKLRNELYNKASSGYSEKYWDEFDRVIAVWRKNTIRYWLKHRRNPEI